MFLGRLVISGGDTRTVSATTVTSPLKVRILSLFSFLKALSLEKHLDTLRANVHDGIVKTGDVDGRWGWNDVRTTSGRVEELPEVAACS